MKKFNIRGNHLMIIVIMLIVVVIGGTFAWFTYQSRKSALVLSIGDINDSKVIIKPYQIRETMNPVNTYTSGVYSQVTASNNSNNRFSLVLRYKINKLDDVLINNGLKYTIVSSDSVNGEYTEVKTGDFKDINGNSLEILRMNIKPKVTDYYRVYLWLDSSTGNQIEVENSMLDIELNGVIENSINIPVLDNGMIPVVIADDGVVKTVNKDNENWYDYNKKKWANIVLVNSTSRDTYLNTEDVVVAESDILAYYVWIPRYKYKVWTTTVSSTGNEQSIEIVFESQDEPMSNGTTVGSFRTHPAFWWDENSDGNVNDGEMIAGMWVGKFETTGDATTPTVKPNLQSLRNQNISTQFQTSLKFAGGTLNNGDVSFSGSNTYGLTNNTDSHMMKNSEWGAVAYLSHSNYGLNEEIYINNSSSYYTGRSGGNVAGQTDTSTYGTYSWIGQTMNSDGSYGTVTDLTLGTKASTTGNITGVYDMSGGAWEYVMGVLSDTNGNPRSGHSIDLNSGFNGLLNDNTSYTNGISFPNSKYYDLYLESQFNGNKNTNVNFCVLETCGGYGLNETALWYGDYSTFITWEYPWFIRGSDWSVDESCGVFTSIDNHGAADSYGSWRSVIISKKTSKVTFDTNGGNFVPINNGDVVNYDTYGQYEYVVPYYGIYKLEAWGAAGGSYGKSGGSGGYTSGSLELKEGEIIYVYVGQTGGNSASATFNGGGAAGGAYNSRGGGGATDFRLVKGSSYSDSSSLASRIMVAGGGGGSDNYSGGSNGGAAGGLIAYNGNVYKDLNKYYSLSQGGTQVSGGAGAVGSVAGGTGTFGIGGGGVSNHGGGGGGGYYGGGGGAVNEGVVGSGAGGSSFISGHTGCVAISSESNFTPRVGTSSASCTTGTSDNLCSIHYSNKKFFNTVIIDGTGYGWSTLKELKIQMPNPNGGNYDSGVGNTGGGYARITLQNYIEIYVSYGNKYGELPTVEKEGYKFIGWSTEKDNFDKLITKDSIVNVSGDNTLYALYAPVYHVLFDLDEGILDKETIIYTSFGEHGYTIPYNGLYKLEAWGASGGSYGQNGGGGGYTSGLIELTKGEKIYVYVGQGGGNSASATFNGGGAAGGAYNSRGGGGATDFRLVTGSSYSDNSSLASRIMVAGGGGGSDYYSGGSAGGAAGGLTAYNGGMHASHPYYVVAKGGTQISGGNGGLGSLNGGTGIFGVGGSNTDNAGHGGGGGGGYYGGGGGSYYADGTVGSGAGGSSFISGHTGCVAVTSGTSITPRVGTDSTSCTTGTSDNLCSVHYSDKKFTDTIMIDGSGYSWSNIKTEQVQMPTPQGSYYSLGAGHTGDGVGKITLMTNAKKVTYSENYGELPIPTKTGYNFVGWNTKSDGSGDFINSDTEVTNYEEHTLYAIWSDLPEYVISYDANGGSGAPSAQTKIYGQTLVLSSTQPTRSGYTFLGWSTSSTATSSSYTSGSEFTINDNITLYAVWKPNNPVSSYKCANGSAGSSPYFLTYGGNCTVINDGSGNWRVKLLSTGTYNLQFAVDTEIDVFLVGGGGSGGSRSSTSTQFGAGGGGGYTKTQKNIMVNANTNYAIIVGSGGSALSSAGNGNDGMSTSAFNFTASGGKGGIGNQTAVYGGAGGSGGGGGGNGVGGSYGANGGSGRSYEGGTGQGTTTCEFGEGTTSSCTNGATYAYAGGGGGAKTGTGGVGGGGNAYTSGTANTGGGGGGGNGSNSGAGGSGIVVIRNSR